MVPFLPDFSLAMEGSYVELAENLAGTGVKVGKFRADGEGSFPTILFFPKHSSKPFKYPSEKRDVASLLAFGNALRLELNAPDNCCRKALAQETVRVSLRQS